VQNTFCNEDFRENDCHAPQIRIRYCPLKIFCGIFVSDFQLFFIGEIGVSGQALNTRGEIRYWRQLNSAAKELSDFLPRLPSFLVVLAGENNRILNIGEIVHGETR
jgi:hypothetical protein